MMLQSQDSRKAWLPRASDLLDGARPTENPVLPRVGVDETEDMERAWTSGRYSN